MSQHFITLDQAKKLTKNFRDNKEAILKTEHQNQQIFTICDTFSKEVFQKLLAKSNCSAIRIYYGMDDSLKIKPIVVAVDGNDRDILPGSGTDDNEDLGNDSKRCPPYCPPSSPLNA